MEQAETLRTIAEVAIAIAGFTGVIVVFGSRARGDWTRIEANRLWLLLAQALIPAILSFLPLLLHSGGLEKQAIWRISNGTFAIVVAALGLHIVFKRRALERDSASVFGARWFVYGTFAVGTFIGVIQFAYAAGFLRTGGAFLFLVGLLYLVVMAALNFWQLLIGSVTVREG